MLAIVTVKSFNQGNPDKNGLDPVILSPTCGRIPSKRVLSGTIAEREGFEVGKNYLVSWTRLEDSEQYGSQYSYENKGQVSTMEILSSLKELGQPSVIEEKAAVPELV